MLIQLINSFEMFPSTTETAVNCKVTMMNFFYYILFYHAHCKHIKSIRLHLYEIYNPFHLIYTIYDGLRCMSVVQEKKRKRKKTGNEIFYELHLYDENELICFPGVVCIYLLIHFYGFQFPICFKTIKLIFFFICYHRCCV